MTASLMHKDSRLTSILQTIKVQYFVTKHNVQKRCLGEQKPEGKLTFQFPGRVNCRSVYI